MARLSRTSRTVALGVCAVVAASGLAACGSDDNTLTWYVNPDGVETLEEIAADCSTDEYDIEVELLPNDATQQRVQLVRRLAAEDDAIDLMSLDPVFVPELANAGYLEEMPAEQQERVMTDDVLSGAAETVTWNDSVYAFPQWANTQVLWYRKSLADAAGLDMSQPVTWDQVIQAASDQGGTVGVQANRYEAYTALINALISGAGGDIVTDTEAGIDAQVDLDSDAARAAASVLQNLASSPAAQPDLTVSNEGTVLNYMFGDTPGEFMTNWTFVYGTYAGQLDAGTISQAEFDDLAWARYPQTVEGEESRPPIGGIDIGVSAFSSQTEWALEAAECVTTTDAQEALAVDAALMPARASVYEAKALTDAFPADLLDLYRQSIEAGAPRPKSAFYSTISSAVQNSWHSPTSVDPQTTPQDSAEFVREALKQETLL